MTQNIFLSYRRDDSRGYTNAIYTLLELHFPADSIFMDVDTLVPGSDFVHSLEEAVENCDIFLAIIGSRWENIEDHQGLRRLDNPEDFVRIEVAHALKRGIPVIPVLVDGAQMPFTENLPDNIKALARRHAFSIGDHMRTDVQRLIKVLEKTFDRLEKERLEREKKEAELLANKQAEEERRSQEKAKADRKAKEQAEADRKAKEKTEADLKAKEQAKAERKAKRQVNVTDQKNKTVQSLRQLLMNIPVWVWPAVGVIVVLAGYGLFGGFLPSGPEETGKTVTLQGDLLLSSTPTVAETQTPTLTSTVAPTATLTPVPSTTPVLEIGSTQVSAVDGMVQVYIPAGDFLMGSDTGESNAQPIHEVYLDGFWMDEHEVTANQFQEFIEETGYSADTENSRNYPVTKVEWIDAQTYCEWAGRRLPTEAEWEKAARGGLVGKIYPWGNTDYNSLPGMIDGAQGDNDVHHPIDVKTFGANGYGLYDMAGNVWEWTADYYSEDYYSISPSTNPLGPETGIPKIIRGGSYFLWMNNLRVDHRFWSYEGGSHIGFRCVTPLEP